MILSPLNIFRGMKSSVIPNLTVFWAINHFAQRIFNLVKATYLLFIDSISIQNSLSDQQPNLSQYFYVINAKRVVYFIQVLFTTLEWILFENIHCYRWINNWNNSKIFDNQPINQYKHQSRYRKSADLLKNLFRRYSI